MKLNVSKPCTENWQNMKTVENGRFCTVCNKNVIDFTSKTNDEIIKYVQKNPHGCGRFTLKQLNEELKVSKYQRYWHTYIFTITMLLLEFSPLKKLYAQNNNIVIEGKLIDSLQKPIVGGNIYLKGSKKKYYTTTNTEGYFKLMVPSNKQSKVVVINAESYIIEEIKVKDIPQYWVKELGDTEVILVGGYTKVSRYRRFWRKITSPFRRKYRV